MTVANDADSLLSGLEPEGLVSDGMSRQKRKSSETRIVILEAAIECLARYGYARTTAQLIAKIADVSRGAMLHHYPTRLSLIAAVIEFAFYRHMERFIRAIRQLTEEQRVNEIAGIAAEWGVCLSREYKAYIELNVATRTDEELRKVFLPLARRHNLVWREEILRVFPEWKHDRRRFDFTSHYLRSALDGLMLNRDIWDQPDTETVLLSFLASTVLLIRHGELAFPPSDPAATETGAPS